MIKRCFDIFFSFLGILLLSPFLLLITLGVKLSSKGTVLYYQKRVGKNNIEFNLFKFRTMTEGADKFGLLTIGGRDQRITKVGYYLRKYKLDELPQLFNVLFGDMSLVGPRPEVRKYVDLYTTEQLRVLTVKPGITDQASIDFSNESDILASAADPEQYYIDVIMPQKLALNLTYINSRYTLIADMKIIFATITKIFG